MVIITNTSGYLLNERAFKQAVNKILGFLKIPRESVLELYFVSRARMRSLNKRFRGKARATTVLSFAGKDFPAGSSRVLGEVFLCPSEIAKQNPFFSPGVDSKKAPAPPLMYYLIHGILHLVGFSHSTRRVQTRMERVEQKIFSELLLNQNFATGYESKTVLRH